MVTSPVRRSPRLQAANVPVSPAASSSSSYVASSSPGSRSDVESTYTGTDFTNSPSILPVSPRKARRQRNCLIK